MILKHLWNFSNKPVYTPYYGIPLLLRLKIVLSLVFWNLIFGIGIALFTEGIFKWLEIDIGKHKTEDLFENYSLQQVFGLMVVLAPLLEEFIFRGPLVFWRRSAFFPFVFYTSCILFGLVHLGNFENGSLLLWWAPLLVAPQIVMGFFLGYLRVKLGLTYAILMHACHNGFLFLLMALIDLQ